ncbi:MAG: DUF3592 domain-containing protein [Deltaproteobacteria bacterium]|nr:DUF3592 domain-containing protein [Deltaproteobacteria bacterium]
MAFGILGIYYGFISQRSRRKVLDWPQAKGKVLHRELLQSRSTKGGYIYSPHVQYIYHVAGTQFTGNRIYRMGAGGSSSQKNQQAFLDQIPEDVWVRHDPQNPSEACLFPERSGIIAMIYAVGTIFLFLGIGWLIKSFI